MIEEIDTHQAYVAMMVFLNHYYRLTSTGEVGDLLASMDLVARGETVDPAMWDEWLLAIDAARKSNYPEDGVLPQIE